jgi:hypothetical protein
MRVCCNDRESRDILEPNIPKANFSDKPALDNNGEILIRQ